MKWVGVVRGRKIAEYRPVSAIILMEAQVKI
jgi:hypothetical protein